MRTRLLVLTSALLLLAGISVGPAMALSTNLTDGLSLDVPVFSSDNVRLVGAVPSAAAISTAFSTDSPHMYVNTLRGIEVYDISNPRLPLLTGYEPTAHFQNENVSLGERADGTKFVLVGFDLYGTTPTYDPSPGTFDEIAVVDVSDPADPHTISRLKFDRPASAHTVTCVDPACTYAYSAGYYSGSGDAREEFFTVIDLTDPANPVDLGIQPSAVGYLGHDWNVDGAGVAWHVGWEGLAAYDVSDPTNPRVLNTSDEHGLNGSEWNNFILHNSLRPNAEEFGKRGQGKGGPRVLRDGKGGPSLAKGSVLLVTEEDYIDTTCTTEGSFQTWHVPELNAKANPTGTPGQGTVTPLDQWNTELFDTGVKSPAGAFCSAHYFDYHQDGIVAQGFYQQGVRFLDVADPSDIKQIGYWITGAQETWGAYFVPAYGEDGRQTGAKTNLVYTNDPTRGLEILELDVPTTAPAETPAVTAPVLDEWLLPNLAVQARASETWGFACPLPLLP
jgi:hypothetical protein